MMKHEFEERIGYVVSDEIYQKVEYVYNYTEYDKDEIALLFDKMGEQWFINRYEILSAKEEAKKKFNSTKASIKKMVDDIVEGHSSLLKVCEEVLSAEEKFQKNIDNISDLYCLGIQTKKYYLDSCDVRNLCIKHNWYTCGSINHYNYLLCDFLPYDGEIDESAFDEVVNDIYYHSAYTDTERKEPITKQLIRDELKRVATKVVVS